MSGRSMLVMGVVAFLAWSVEPVQAQRVRFNRPGVMTGDSIADARILAQRIDQLIEKQWKPHDVKGSPRAEDTVFFRRLHLDLTGRIPSLLKASDYITEDRPERHEILDQLLESPRFAEHFAQVLRAEFLGDGNNVNNQLAFLKPQLEIWLKDHLQKNTSYDRIVQQMVAPSLAAQVNPYTSDPSGRTGIVGSAQAFYQANENKPENLAGATSRLFLGIKLECAQCHEHPFARWTRNQFWEYAAFFNMGPPPGVVNAIVPAGKPFFPGREIQIPGTTKTVQARFLDGSAPDWNQGKDARTVVAEWLTSAENPFFAKAAVDLLWTYFFGVSLLEPLQEGRDDTVPTHPELLDEMARQFVAHKFDLKFLIRAIVQTQAYQRSSRGESLDKLPVQLFARMSIRGLSPEQLFDSFAEATGYEEPTPRNPYQRFQQIPGQPGSLRAEFLSRFADQSKRLDAQTSILQALFLMNNKEIDRRVKAEQDSAIDTLSRARVTNERRVETLYLLVLSRRPRTEEVQRLTPYLEKGGARGDLRQALTDVYWALLNSAEFALNH